MAKVFISHSSKDAAAAERLATALKDHRHEVWLDAWALDVGDPLVHEVQKGLDEANVLAVWLTSAAVHSGWVAEEWQAKFAAGASERRAALFPLLAEDCVIPTFLAARKIADFRKSFDHGLQQVLRALRRIDNSQPQEATGLLSPPTVLEGVIGFLRDLESAEIPLPTLGRLRVVDALRALPRSGKLIRLESMTPKVEIRSLYDHVLSVGHSADVLLPLLRPRLADSDLLELARVIAYHDVCEVVLGDVPQYTKLSPARRQRARVSAQIKLSEFPNGEPERIANAFIALFLEHSERDSLRATQRLIDGTSEVKRFFYALDKVDPIVGTWRYLHHYRQTAGFNVDEFLDRMRHFFENPRVATAVLKNVDDARLARLVRELQTPALARAYFLDPLSLDNHRLALPGPVVRKLIEGRPLLPAAGWGRKASTIAIKKAMSDGT
jgi:5'-deoxynucleotidase YfbR-like HD superfamily hydrolase